MDYPAEIATFTVTGSLWYGNPDTEDAGIAPNLEPIRGASVLFEPDAETPIFTAPVAKGWIYQRAVPAATDYNGQITGMYDSSPDVMLPYYPGQTWKMTVSVPDFPDRVLHFTGSAGGTVNLGTVVPVPMDPGTDIIAWQAVVSQVTTDAAAAAASAAAAAASNPGVANGTAQLDASIKLKEAQVPTRLSSGSLAAAFAPQTGATIAAAQNGVAVANSAAANTTALNALHSTAASLGATIALPPGNIAVNALTLLAPMVGAIGRKTKLVASAVVTVGADRVTVADLILESSNQTAIIAAHRTDLTLRDIEVQFNASVTTNWLALDPYNVDRLRVIGCTFHIGGLQLSLCDDFLIDGNYWDCEYLNTNEPCHISGQSSGHFVNNTVYRSLTDAVDLYSSGHYCVISNNRFYGLKGASGIECKVTMSDVPGNTSGPGNVFEAVIISNNVLRDFVPTASGTRYGIYAEYVDSRAVPAFNITETNRAIIISGNVIEDMNAADPGGSIIASYWGIGFTGHNGLVVNNIIRNAGSWNGGTPGGIRLSQPTGTKCVGVRVAGNVIAGMDAWTGIEVGTLERCQIDDNIVRTDEVSARKMRFGVSVASGATVTDSSISGNLFECDHASGMGIRTASSSASLTRVRVQSNTFKFCGVSIGVAQHCSFSLNVMDNALNSQNFAVGVSGTSCRGNTYADNSILMSSDYGLVLTDHDGYSVSGSSFRTTNRGLLLVGATRNGIVTGNLSIGQSGGTEMPHYSGVSGPDQATHIVASNLVTT